MSDAFVLVHGGFQTASCWERLIPHLALPALAVDLPGRGKHPAPMSEVTLEACVRSVIADIDTAGLEGIVLVGHSLGGATVPIVASRIPERISHLVLLSTLVAPDGGSVADGFLPETREDAIRRLGTDGDPTVEMTTATHRALLEDGMSEADVDWVLGQVCADSRHLFTDKGSRAQLPANLPRTYIRLKRDQSVSWAQQEHAISLMPGLRTREIDCAHFAMVTHPNELAEILNEIARGVTS